MRALLTGATGFIGRRLATRLERPVVLGRDVERLRRDFVGSEAHAWDSMDAAVPPAALDGVETVFHLAGEPVAGGRWTAEKKRRILESREHGTRQIVEAMKLCSDRPRVLISASAVGFYGSRGDEILDESAPPGGDFLAEVCVAWEREAARAAELGVRVVRLRTGIVLGPRGGALAQMLPPFRLGLGGPLGDGRQWMPWIHLDDLVSLMLYAAAREDLSGPVNGVAPEPVTNGEFTRALGAALHRPAILPAPYFLLKLALGEFADVLYASQRAVPKAALDHGFRFEHPVLAGALAAVLAST